MGNANLSDHIKKSFRTDLKAPAITCGHLFSLVINGGKQVAVWVFRIWVLHLWQISRFWVYNLQWESTLFYSRKDDSALYK